MGVCATKQEKKISKFPVEKLFPVTETKTNENETNKSEFYYFVEWMISFNFYKRLHSTPEGSNIKILSDDPKSSSIFKLIKAVDCSYLRDKFNPFSSLTEVLQDKNSDDIEREHLKYLFIHLAKDNMLKLKKILTDGPPNNMRWFIWMTLAKYAYDEVETKLNINNSKIFIQLVGSGIDSVKETISNEQTEINTSKLFSSNYNWQTSLFNVFTAINSYDKKLNYCNGMKNIVANSLIVSDFNELESFLIVRYIYSSEYGLQIRHLIADDSPQLNYYSFIVDKLTESRCPNIFTYFMKMNLDRTMWVVKWMQTLFTFLDIPDCVRVWDCVLALGCEFLTYFSLACIKFCEKDILFSQISSYEELNDLIKSKLNVEKAIKYSLEFHVGKNTQIRFDQLFFYELLNNDIIEEQHNEETSIIENNEDLYQEMLNNIKLIYNKNFNKEEKEYLNSKITAEEKKSKITAIKKMKEIYFKEQHDDQAETQMLCSFADKPFKQYLKEKDENKRIINKKTTRPKSSSNVNKNISQKNVNNHIRFVARKSQGEFPSGFGVKKNYSLIELNENNSSSDMSSESKNGNNSINKMSKNDIFLINKEYDEDNEDSKMKDLDIVNINNSIITPEDFDEDSFDEEAMIKIIEEKGMDSFLKENIPKKIVKVNP